jgi:multicomponent Na+:H+ antiporter subunit A
MHALIFSVLMPFLAAAFIPFIHNRLRRLNLGWFVIVVPLMLFVFFVSQLSIISSGKVVTATLAWIPSLGIDFTVYLDGLSLILALLITGMGSLVVLYSIYYLSSTDSLPHFYAYLLLFMGAMLGVVLSDNLLVLYVFWELTSISSFLLIAFWYHRKNSRYGAQKSLLITVFGGFAMLAGFLMLHVMSGTFSIRELIANAGQYTEHSLFYPALFLVLLGAFTKSAQFPFHIWLPDAMEAPTPVSAYLFGRPRHSCIRGHFGLVLDSHTCWSGYTFLGSVLRRPPNRSESAACLFHHQPAWLDHEFVRARIGSSPFWGRIRRCVVRLGIIRRPFPSCQSFHF